MFKKIAEFIKFMLIAALVIGGIFAIGGMFMVTLEVHCDLQSDQFYTCQARDTLFGRTLSEVSAEQIYGIERDLTCKGSGPNRGCSAHAEFKTSTADRIVASNLYTDPDQVQKAVNALSPLMEGKSTPIDISFPPSTFMMVVMTSVASCVFIIFLLVALISMFGKDPKDLESRAIDLRRKN